MPPCGLPPIWPVASLLGRSSIAADTLLPSRLATGQIGGNERMRIYEIDRLAVSMQSEDGFALTLALGRGEGERLISLNSYDLVVSEAI